ncbi:hypothetical protein BDZ45DRAFT_798940 [Acephala macrosclerotiorum]|nr:hypothetical protein BDZ45DRAFT_798940 [Acephala macrosclerotiorum]
MSGSGGYYKYRCKYWLTYNCPHWVWVNNAPCAHCLADGRDDSDMPTPPPLLIFSLLDRLPSQREEVDNNKTDIEDTRKLPEIMNEDTWFTICQGREREGCGYWWEG